MTTEQRQILEHSANAYIEMARILLEVGCESWRIYAQRAYEIMLTISETHKLQLVS